MLQPTLIIASDSTAPEIHQWAEQLEAAMPTGRQHVLPGEWHGVDVGHPHPGADVMTDSFAGCGQFSDGFDGVTVVDSRLDESGAVGGGVVEGDALVVPACLGDNHQLPGVGCPGRPRSVG